MTKAEKIEELERKHQDAARRVHDLGLPRAQAQAAQDAILTAYALSIAAVAAAPVPMDPAG